VVLHLRARVPQDGQVAPGKFCVGHGGNLPENIVAQSREGAKKVNESTINSSLRGGEVCVGHGVNLPENIVAQSREGAKKA